MPSASERGGARGSRVGVLLNPLNPGWKNYPEVLNDAARAWTSSWRGWRRVASRKSTRRSRRCRPGMSTACSPLTKVRSLVQRRCRNVSWSWLRAASCRRSRTCRVLPEQVDWCLSRQPRSHSTRRRPLRSSPPSKGPKWPSCRLKHPAEFQLIINVKTAQELGITIPPSILLRADEVIK